MHYSENEHDTKMQNMHSLHAKTKINKVFLSALKEDYQTIAQNHPIHYTLYL